MNRLVKKKKGQLILDGKEKAIYQGTDTETFILHFKDSLYDHKNDRLEHISGKGVINNRISELLMTRLSEIGIPNYFIETLNMREQVIKMSDHFVFNVIIRNVATSTLSSRIQIEEGVILPNPIIEFVLNNEQLNFPLINDDHITTFRWADKFEIDEIRVYSYRVNDYLCGLFNAIGIRLVELNLQFGHYISNNVEHIILTSDLTPDNCKLWDIKTNDILDKDRFLLNMEDISKGYKEVAKRLGVLE